MEIWCRWKCGEAGFGLQLAGFGQRDEYTQLTICTLKRRATQDQVRQ
jgi:hypothetical protein